MASTAPDSRPEPSQPAPNRLIELALLFLRLGATAFGGPAAHVALMREAFVARRKWLTDQQFLDLLGATNLIPGPNSTEVAIHIGYLRAGLPGLVVAGTAFILPAMLMVIGLAWGYARYGETPQVGWVLYGIKPVIIAIIAQALWGLGKQAVKGPLTALTGGTALLLYLLGANEIAMLFTAGFLVMLIRNIGSTQWRGWSGLRSYALFLPTLRVGGLAAAGASSLAAVPFSMAVMFLTFLKIGSVLYGSGYVLLAFLRADFVERLGWITEEQLIEAIAIGQVELTLNLNRSRAESRAAVMVSGSISAAWASWMVTPAISPSAAALTPSSRAEAQGEARSFGMSGLVSATNRKAGRKMPAVAITAPGTPPIK